MFIIQHTTYALGSAYAQNGETITIAIHAQSPSTYLNEKCLKNCSPPTIQTMTCFLPPRSTKGIWFGCDNGMFWPPVPGVFKADQVMPLYKSTYGVDSIEMVNFSDQVYGYCDGNGRYEEKYSPNPSFHEELVGPIMFLRASDDMKEGGDNDDDEDGGEHPLSWSELISTLNRSHHSCGWPLTNSEKTKKPSLASLDTSPTVTAKSFIPDDIWTALWKQEDDENDIVPSAKKQKTENKEVKGCNAWYWVPLVYRGHILPLEMGKLDLAKAKKVEGDPKNDSTRGILIRREKIVDPRLPYGRKAKQVDSVSLTFLTVQGLQKYQCQRPESIAHFLQDGTLVRCQVNCFAFGTDEADGGYLQEILDDIKGENLWKNVKKI